MDDESLPAADFDLDLGDRTDVSCSPTDCTWVEPVETPAHLPSPLDEPAPAPGPAPSRKAPVGPVVNSAAVRRSLAEIWPEPPRKRRLPRRLRIVLAGAAVLLVAVIAFGNSGTKLRTEAMAPLADDMVVSAESLRNRREVRPEDFRPRGSAQPVLAPARAPVAIAGPVPQATAETLAERRARRQSDPQDVRSKKTRRTAARRPATEPPGYDDGPVYVTVSSQPGAANAPGSPSPIAPSGERHGILAEAGTSIPSVLTSPVDLSGGSATVVARAEGPPGVLRGARFLGTASATAGRATIRFHAAFLPDGQKVRVDAEAQDEEGAFGLRREGEPSASEDEQGSVLSDVAKETATDIVSDAIGAGVATRAVDRYMNGSRSRRPSQPTRTVSLAAGTKLQIFLHESVEVAQ